MNNWNRKIISFECYLSNYFDKNWDFLQRCVIENNVKFWDFKKLIWMVSIKFGKFNINDFEILICVFVFSEIFEDLSIENEKENDFKWLS